MERATVERWVEEMAGAWEGAEPSHAAALFAPEAVYRSHPFSAARRGRRAIEEYWRAAVQVQSDLDLHLGSPIVDGHRAAVEWWVSLVEEGAESVSSGSLFLTFGLDGLCTSLREVWMEQPGRRPPYAGWGS